MSKKYIGKIAYIEEKDHYIKCLDIVTVSEWTYEVCDKYGTPIGDKYISTSQIEKFNWLIPRIPPKGSAAWYKFKQKI